MQRYFIDRCSRVVEISSKSNIYYHLTKVLRCKVDDKVEMCDSNGKCYMYHITKINASTINFGMLETVSRNTELADELVLVVSLLKNNNFELVLQKAVELGVTRIIPLETSRTVVKSSNFKLSKYERFNKIIVEACEQSKRQVVPVLSSVSTIADLENLDITNKFVAFENAFNNQSLLECVLGSAGSYAIVVGPEGGFCESEIKLLNKFGFNCVNLGNRILRSETAAITAVGLVSMIMDTR